MSLSRKRSRSVFGNILLWNSSSSTSNTSGNTQQGDLALPSGSVVEPPPPSPTSLTRDRNRTLLNNTEDTNLDIVDLKEMFQNEPERGEEAIAMARTWHKFKRSCSSETREFSSQTNRIESLNLYLQEIISQYLQVISDCDSPEFMYIFHDGKRFTHYLSAYFMSNLEEVMSLTDHTENNSALEEANPTAWEKVVAKMDLSSTTDGSSKSTEVATSLKPTRIRSKIAQELAHVFLNEANSFNFETTIEILARLMEKKSNTVTQHIISNPNYLHILIHFYKSIIGLRHQDIEAACEKYSSSNNSLGKRKRTQSNDVEACSDRKQEPVLAPQEKRRSVSADLPSMDELSPTKESETGPQPFSNPSSPKNGGTTHHSYVTRFHQCCKKFDRFLLNIIKTPSVEPFIKRAELVPILLELLVSDSQTIPEENFEYRTTIFRALLSLFKHGIETGISDQLHKKKSIAVLLDALRAPPSSSNSSQSVLHSSLSYKTVSYVIQILVLILEESQQINYHLVKSFQNAAGYRMIQDALIDHQERFDEPDDFMINALRASSRLVCVSDKFSAENQLMLKQFSRDELEKSPLRNAAAFHALSQTLLKSHHITFQQRLVEEMLFFIAEYGKTSPIIHQWHPVSLYIKNLDSLHDPVQDSVLKLVEFMIAGLDLFPQEELEALCQLLNSEISATLAEKILTLVTKILHLKQEYLVLFRDVQLIDVLVKLFASKFQKMRSVETNSVPQITTVKNLCTDVLVELLKESSNVKYFRDLDAVSVMQDLVLSDFCRNNAIRIFQTIIVNDTIQNQVDVKVLVELLQSSSWSRVKLKTSIFNGLIRILQHNDGAKDAFANEGGFIATASVIVNSQWKDPGAENSSATSPTGTDSPPAVHELNNLFEALFKALTAALTDHHKNKITLLNQVDQGEIAQSLAVNNVMKTSCAKDILQYVLDMGTERCFRGLSLLSPPSPSSVQGTLRHGGADLSDSQDHFIHGLNVGKSPILHNPFALQIILKLLQEYSVFSSQTETILLLLDYLARADPFNLEQLGSISIVDYLLTNHLDVIKNCSHPLHALCMGVVEQVACYKLSALEWRKLFALTRNAQDTPASIMKVLSHAARAEVYSDTPFVEYLSNSRALIVSLDERTWPPAQGYTFMAWVYIRSDSPTEESSLINTLNSLSLSSSSRRGSVSVTKKSNVAFTLLSLRSDDNRSNLEIAVNTDNQVILNTHNKPKFFTFSDFTFENNKWYHVAITHSKYRILHSPSTATLYVNGRFIQTQKINYLGSTSAGGLHVRGDLGYNSGQQSSHSLRLGPTLFYEEVLPTESIPYFFIVGRNYTGIYATSRILKHSDQAFSPNYVALFDIEDRNMSREDVYRHNSEMSSFSLKRVKLLAEKLVFSFHAGNVELFDLARKKGDSNVHQKSNALFLQNVRNSSRSGKPKVMLQGSAYCCTPRSLSNDILLFDGIKLIFALIERADSSEYLYYALDILQNLMFDCNDVIQEVNRLNGSKIIALFLTRKSHLITTSIVDTLWKMTMMQDSHGSIVLSNKHICKNILFDNEIWKKCSTNVQVYLYQKMSLLLKDPLYPYFNAARLKNMGIMTHLMRVLMEVPPLDAVVEIVDVIKHLLMHNASPDDMIPLCRFLSFSLVSDGNPLSVQKDAIMQSNSAATLSKFSRTHRSQVMPALNVIAARNLILRSFLELIADDDYRSEILDALSKHMNVKWFTMFLINVAHSSTIVLLMHLWCAVASHERIDSISHLFQQGLIEYCNQRDVFCALLALQLDVTIPTISEYLNASQEEPICFSKLLQRHDHFTHFQLLPVIFTLLKFACKNSSRASYPAFKMQNYVQSSQFLDIEKKSQARQRWNFVRSFVKLRPFASSSMKESFEVDYFTKEKLQQQDIQEQHTVACEVLDFIEELFDCSDEFKNQLKRTESLQVLISIIFSNVSHCASTPTKSSSFTTQTNRSPRKLDSIPQTFFRSAPSLTSPFNAQEYKASSVEERDGMQQLFKQPHATQVMHLLNGILMHQMQVSTKGVKLFEDILMMHPKMIPQSAADLFKEIVTLNLMHGIRERISDVRLFVSFRSNVCSFCSHLIVLYIVGVLTDHALLFQFSVDLIRQLYIVESEKQPKRSSFSSNQPTPKDAGTSQAFRALNSLVLLLLCSDSKSDDELGDILDEMINRDWFVTCVNPYNSDITFFGCLVNRLLPLVVLSDSTKTRENAVTCMKLIVAAGKLQIDEATTAGMEIKRGLSELLHKESHQFIAWLLQNQDAVLKYFEVQYGESVSDYTSGSAPEEKKRKGLKLSMSTVIRKSSAGRPESKHEQYFTLRRECQYELETLKEDLESKMQKHREQVIIGSKFASEQWKNFKTLLMHERAVWHHSGITRKIKQVDFTENPHRMRKKLIDCSVEELDKLPVSQITPPTPKRSSSQQQLVSIEDQSASPSASTTSVDDLQFEDVSKQQKRQSSYILNHYSKVEELLLSPNKQDRYKFDSDTSPSDHFAEDEAEFFSDQPQARDIMNDMTDVQSTVTGTHYDLTETGLITDTALDDEDEEDLSDFDMFDEDILDEDFKIRKHLDANETILHTYNCLRVTGLDGQKALFVIGVHSMYVIDNYHLTEDNEIIEIEGQTSKEMYTIPNSMLQAQQQQSTSVEHKCIKISLSNLKNVMKRRFLLRETAVEFFCHDGQNFLIVFEKTEMLKVYDAVPVNCKRVINQKLLTAQWQRGEISNFDYLMKLNTLAGRSYNDLTQYPVFPWVLRDYESEEIDLHNPSSYRDLSKPMGAITEKRAKAFRDRFETWDDMNVPKFHYGSHYSSAAIVLYYLIRLEPFTSQNIQLQGGKFDIADRLFFSVKETFKSATEEHNMADVKELIPEFYYFPDFLKNRDGLQLGVRSSSKIPVNHVELPLWCNGDVYEFIRLNRKALESDIVSEMLPAWIDLIFGYKQRGVEAEKAVNVFYYLTYEGTVDIDKIEDPVERRATIAQISNFGQTPQQLFTKPHPRKTVRKNPLSLLTDDPTRITYSEFKRVGHSVGSIAQGHRELVILKPNCVIVPPKKTKYLSWNEADGSVRVYRPYASNAITKSHETVKCVWENMHINSRATVAQTTEDGEFLIMGDSNGLVCVWQIFGARKQNRRKGAVAHPQLKKRLCGHESGISAISICENFSIIVTGSLDGTAIVWDLNRLSYSFSIQDVEANGSPIVALDVNHSSGDIVTCTSNTMALWTLNGDMIARVETGRSAVSTVKLLYENEWSDNYYILTGHESGAMRVWRVVFHGNERDYSSTPTEDVAAPRRHFNSKSKQTVIRLLTEHHGHGVRITSFFLSRDKRKLYTGDDRGSVLLWSKASPVLTPMTASSTTSLRYSSVGGSGMFSPPASSRAAMYDLRAEEMLPPTPYASTVKRRVANDVDSGVSPQAREDTGL